MGYGSPNMGINGDRDQLSKVSLILNLLAASASEQTWWGVREISKNLGISTTTIHRTLSALTDIGYTRHDPGSGRYAIGTELKRISARIRGAERFAEVARPSIQQLTKQSGEATILAQLDGITRSLVFVDMVAGAEKLHYEIPLYKHVSLYRGASGLSVLAHLPGEDEPPSSDTRCSLQSIRSSGVALTTGDRIPGALGISSPVLAEGGMVLGSVTLSMPQSRTPSEKDRHHLFQLVRECASQIRRNLASHTAQHHFAVPEATRK